MSAALGIVGVGLIGGSIGLRARRNGAHVVGSDRDPTALKAALELGAIDAPAAVHELYCAADVVVFATHLESTLTEVARLAQEPQARRYALLLDVSSVKMPVVRAAHGLKNFVATHPMAGSERSGVAAARADLFDGVYWAYVPTGDETLDCRACEFIRWCGAIPVAVDAEVHDRSVAFTSHVPQIMASRYSALLREPGADAQQLYGPVARELLRIADMNPTMWNEILKANAQNIIPVLRRLARELDTAAGAIAANGFERMFQ